MGATAEVNGARAVAETFSGRARAAQPALIDGEPGAVWSLNGQPKVVFAFTITATGTITGIEMISDPATVSELDLDLLDT
jgi:RNA polymerase sigma-70 factor (ECF subfamily)